MLNTKNSVFDPFLPDNLIWVWFPWCELSSLLPGSHASGPLRELNWAVSGLPSAAWEGPEPSQRPLTEAVLTGGPALRKADIKEALRICDLSLLLTNCMIPRKPWASHTKECNVQLEWFSIFKQLQGIWNSGYSSFKTCADSRVKSWEENLGSGPSSVLFWKKLGTAGEAGITASL